jgi:Cof subfamily protein (haloacid dehalogenase superfamily)
MKSFQALLIDVDGTLVKNDRLISPVVIKAIHQAREKGLLIGLSTGRAYVSLTAIFEQIGWEGTHIVAGGAQVFDGKNKKVVWEKIIDSADVKWLFQEVIERSGGVVIVKDDALYSYDELVKRFEHHPWKIPAKNLSELTNDWSSPLISVHQISPELEKFLLSQDRLHAVKMKSLGGEEYFDVTAHDVTKREGLLVWSKHTGVALDQVAAVGDGLNDQELMSLVGWPVAMGNSVPELKQIAKMVVNTNERDGVAELINWLLN